MSQMITTQRYEDLLRERMIAGRRYVDELCHGAPFDDAHRIFGRIEQLDRVLDGFRRYRHDEYRVVMAAEDERWHVPGEPPANDPVCSLCIKTDMVVPRAIVLPHAVLSGSRFEGAA